MEQALMKAHEAGDIESAKTLAQALKEAPMETMRDVSLVGGMVPEVTEKGKEQLLQAVQQEVPLARTGIERGLEDVGEGLKQLALEAAEVGNIIPKGTAEAYTKATDVERANFEEQYGEIPLVSGTRTIGQTAPYLALPGGPAKTLAQRVATGARVGGAVGGTTYVPEGGSRTTQAATGAIAGVAIPMGLEGLTRGSAKVINAIRGRLKTPVMEKIVSLGEQHKVPVLAPDIAGRHTKTLSSISEEIPWIGIGGERLSQAQAAGESAKRVVQAHHNRLSVTGYRGLNIIEKEAAKGDKQAINLLNEMGEAADDWNAVLTASAKSKAYLSAKIGSRKFTKVDTLADKLGDINTTKTVSKIDELIAAQERGVDIDTTLINKLNDWRSRLTGQKYKFSDMRGFNSELGGLISDARTGQNVLIGSKASNTLQQIKNSVEDDLNDFVAKQPQVRAQWKAANKFWAEKVVPLKDKSLGSAMKNRPADEIFDLFIKKGKAGRANKFYQALDPKGRAAVRSGLHERALEHAETTDAKIMSGRYADFMEKHQAATGVFFKGKEKAEVDGFTNLMRHVERAGKFESSEAGGGRLARLVVFGGTAIGAGTSPVGTATVGGLLYGMKKLWTTKAGRNLLLASSKVEPGSPAMQKLMGRIRNLIIVSSIEKQPTPLEGEVPTLKGQE